MAQLFADCLETPKQRREKHEKLMRWEMTPAALTRRQQIQGSLRFWAREHRSGVGTNRHTYKQRPLYFRCQCCKLCLPWDLR
jgi:hypothetical protein